MKYVLYTFDILFAAMLFIGLPVVMAILFQENDMFEEKLYELVTDLFWEYDRMTSSGQQTLDKLADLLKIEPYDKDEN